MIVINRTARVVVFGDGVRLVPETPAEIHMSEDQMNAYPAIAAMLASGALEILTQDEAEQEEQKLEEKTAADLRAYAEAHNIDVAGLTKKAVRAVLYACRGVFHRSSDETECDGGGIRHGQRRTHGREHNAGEGGGFAAAICG